jgi:branched-chain amino acid transport system ATP-binding protein
MLELRNVAVDHGKLRALWDLSLTVRERECVALLGANGAGKSTTMGAIIGLYPIAAGQMTYAGAVIAGHSTSQNVAAGISLVPEGRRLFAEMSVEENLRMGAYARSNRPRLHEGLERVYGLFPILRNKRRQSARELSGGQQQMVAIGRALMSNPKLLLLDEPFNGVAPLLVEEIIRALRAIALTGVTMLLVEQNIHRALEFVERAYVIENGRSVLEGSREELLGNPGFSKQFLGLD